MKIEINGTTLPVDPRFVPVCTLDSSGQPVPLSSSGGGGGGGDASAAHQQTQIDQQEQQLLQGDAANGYLQFIGGRAGSDFIADTAAHSGNWGAFVVIADAQIAAITLSGTSTGGAHLTGISLYAGQQIIAPFTGITLASGVLQLVKLS